MNSHRIWVYLNTELLLILIIYIFHMGCFASYYLIYINTHQSKWLLEFGAGYLGIFQYNVEFLEIKFQNAKAIFLTLIKYLAAMCGPGP